MKKASIITTLVLFYGFGYGQNKFQSLIQRIALLEVYLGYLKSGYKVVKGGLNTFRDLKNGEFGLHKDYFDRLSVVNPKIKHYSKVTEIIGLCAQLIKETKAAQKQLLDSKELTPQEIDWLLKTYERFTEDCHRTIDILLDVITDGHLKFTDDQRLLKIENLQKQMIAKARFSRAFIRGTKTLILQRIEERSSIRKIKDLYQIK